MVLDEAAVLRLISPFLVPLAGPLSIGLPSVVGESAYDRGGRLRSELTSADP